MKIGDTVDYDDDDIRRSWIMVLCCDWVMCLRSVSGGSVSGLRTSDAVFLHRVAMVGFKTVGEPSSSKIEH